MAVGEDCCSALRCPARASAGPRIEVLMVECDSCHQEVVASRLRMHMRKEHGIK